MAILSKLYIIACLFLNFLMCQRQEYPNYSLNEQNSENSMPKYPRSGEMDNFDQWQPNSELIIPICPAENPNDVSYETLHALKKNYKKIVMDEEDDENLDIAAADDDDEADDNQFMAVDHIGDDKVFAGRISCLMGDLENHIQIMVSHVKNLKSHLATPKGTGRSKTDDMEPSAKKTKDFQVSPANPGPNRKSPDSKDDNLVALGQILRPKQLLDLSKTLPVLQKQKDTSLYGSDSESQGWVPRREDLKEEPSPRRYGAYEAKLSRLLTNREAIERNMMNMMGPRHGERM